MSVDRCDVGRLRGEDRSDARGAAKPTYATEPSATTLIRSTRFGPSPSWEAPRDLVRQRATPVRVSEIQHHGVAVGFDRDERRRIGDHHGAVVVGTATTDGLHRVAGGRGSVDRWRDRGRSRRCRSGTIAGHGGVAGVVESSPKTATRPPIRTSPSTTAAASTNRVTPTLDGSASRSLGGSTIPPVRSERTDRRRLVDLVFKAEHHELLPFPIAIVRVPDGHASRRSRSTRRAPRRSPRATTNSHVPTRPRSAGTPTRRAERRPAPVRHRNAVRNRPKQPWATATARRDGATQTDSPQDWPSLTPRPVLNGYASASANSILDSINPNGTDQRPAKTRLDEQHKLLELR